MITNQDTIFDIALSLPEETRVDLAARLVDSLDQSKPVQLSEAWLQEIRERLAAYDRGEVKGIPADQFFESLRAGEKGDAG